MTSADHKKTNYLFSKLIDQTVVDKMLCVILYSIFFYLPIYSGMKRHANTLSLLSYLYITFYNLEMKTVDLPAGVESTSVTNIRMYSTNLV